MPSTLTYPGVYVEEIPSGVRTIAGVATSVAAFVGHFSRGPLNEAVQIFGFADFEREFGGLRADSEASYAIQQFFLNGGTEAWVVRVASGTPGAATATLTDANGNDVFTVSAGRRIRGASVSDPGTWGDAIRVDVDYETSDPDTLFNLTVTEETVQDGRLVVRQTETFRNLSMLAASARYAVEVVNEDSRLVQLAATDPPSTQRPASSGTLGAELGASFSAPMDGTTFEISVDPDGTATAAETYTATVDYGGATAPTTALGFRPHLEAAIRNAEDGGAASPLLSAARVRIVGSGDAARYHVLAGSGADATPALTLTFSGTSSLNLDTDDTAVVRGQRLALANGADGDRPDAAAFLGSEAAHSGLFALDDVDLFNLLALPGAVTIPSDADGNGMRSVYAAATAYCERRRAFLLVDVPVGTDTLADAQEWVTNNDGLRHRNAAVYFPRPLVADALADNRLRSVAASGTLAGLYGRTDAT